MATVFICDGCEKAQDENEPFEEFGLVGICQYCPTCAVGVKEILAQRDEAHEAIVAAWEQTMGIRVALWKEKHPKGRLPDE